MNPKFHLSLVLCFVALTLETAISQDIAFVETQITLQTTTGKLFGTLIAPKDVVNIPIALIIAGSGPTDRDGNNPMMKNNSLKNLAVELSKHGIATLRYDKRGIGESAMEGKNEADLRFDAFVNDANDWISLIKQDNRFSQLIVIGHSEGSLIGMLVASKADKYISLAGAGQSADKIIKDQLGSQPKEIQDLAFPVIDSLKNGKTVDNVNQMFYSIFRPSLQPYMISWFKYDPQIEVQKLTIPILLLQGTADLQVSVEEAKRLSIANPNARLVLIDNMNHVLKIIEGDTNANIAAYSNPDLPIAEELIVQIADFILHD